MPPTLNLFEEPVFEDSVFMPPARQPEHDCHARLSGRILRAWEITYENGDCVPVMSLFPWLTRLGLSCAPVAFKLPEGWTAQPENTLGRLLITADEDYMTLTDAVSRGYARRIQE